MADSRDDDTLPHGPVDNPPPGVSWPVGWTRPAPSARAPRTTRDGGGETVAMPQVPAPPAGVTRPPAPPLGRTGATPPGRTTDPTATLRPTSPRPPTRATVPPRAAASAAAARTYPAARPAPPPYDPRAPRRSGATSSFRALGRALRWVRRVPLILLLVLILVIGLVMFFFSRVAKVDALQDYDGRPAATPGTDWLLVGSDSRAGLSEAERKRLTTGGTSGRRTDTIILLHVPARAGAPTLVSLPRDSYVPIPGRGRNKLNAAYAIGGAPLLVQTVERATGIRIDHYAEIGFSGFVGLVDAVGGVELCPKRAIKDRKSGLAVAKGCQEMDGATALGYVRARYFDPKGDLGRVERQQEFLGSIFEKATEPGVAFNPIRVVRAADAGTKALTVDEEDGVLDLARFALAMRAVAGDKGKKTTVPVADPNYRTRVGSVVLWDRPKARELFNSLR